MPTYTLTTNYTNNVSNATLRSSTDPLSSIVTARTVSGTQTGGYLYNVAYLHPDSGYEFTSVGDISFVLDGNSYTPGSGVIGASLNPSGYITIQTTQQNPSNTYNLVLNGTATLEPPPPPPGGGGPGLDPLEDSGGGSGGSSGASTTSGVGGTGYAYSFNGAAQSILVRHNSNFDVFNKNDDWAISFWGSLPISQSAIGDFSTEKLIVSKYIAERYINEDGTITTQNNEVGSYPFKIGVYTKYADTPAGTMFFETSDGTYTTRVTSSAQYNDESYRHYTFNKTGSFYEIWVNGARVASQSVSYPFNINNQKDILIGNDSYGGTSAFSGSVDEFQIHRVGLTSAEIGSLADNNLVSGSYLQKNDVGYVFYKQGMIVVTDPRPRYQNVLLGDGNGSYTNKNYQVDYRSTKVVEEVVALCEIGKEEFLVTSNPSARYTPSENEFQLAGFTMSSSFYPYVTTLGLYNDMGDLLATAKLGSPLKRRSDVDVTIQVKFDID